MQISLDFGDVPSVLAALTDARTLQMAVNAAAESFVDDTLEWIANGKAFTPHNGGAGLEGAIGWHGNGDGTSTIFANKDYANFVEHGTGLLFDGGGHSSWVIRPKEDRKSVV